MNKLSLSYRHLALFALALLVVPTLLCGCGGLAALVTGGGDNNVLVQAFGLGPQNYDLLSSLTPTMNRDWYTNPARASLTINTTDYTDGIKAAVYANEVRTGVSRYHLGGQYSAIGIEFGIAADEPNSSAQATFRFFGDGKLISLARDVKKADRRKFVLDVRGVQDFELGAESVPQTGGVSRASTLVGWGNATLIKEAGIKYLVDLTATSNAGWSPLPAPGSIAINWRPYPHSIVGTLHKGQPAASCVYDLGGLYKKFSTIAGISQHETDTTATAKFEVLADGVSRGVATIPQQAELPLQLDVSGVHTLELRAQVASSSENDIDVGWGMAMLLEK